MPDGPEKHCCYHQHCLLSRDYCAISVDESLQMKSSFGDAPQIDCLGEALNMPATPVRWMSYFRSTLTK